VCTARTWRCEVVVFDRPDIDNAVPRDQCDDPANRLARVTDGPIDPTPCVRPEVLVWDA